MHIHLYTIYMITENRLYGMTKIHPSFLPPFKPTRYVTPYNQVLASCILHSSMLQNPPQKPQEFLTIHKFYALFLNFIIVVCSMASNNTNYNNQQQQQQQSMHHSTYESSFINNNTTFVQANPSNFRAIVQQLTGSPSTASSSKGSPSCRDVSDVGSFKLHERRQQQGARKLEMIKLNNNNNNAPCYYHGPMLNGLVRATGGNEVAMVSPVSTLDGLGLGVGSPSPRTHPRSSMSEEEERVVIAEKGFYLHPISPLSGGVRDCEPQLLPLFPLHSPRDGQD